jgi:peptidoglycan/xylan/chitin deacetylase (PgdA/CDA1 family)
MGRKEAIARVANAVGLSATARVLAPGRCLRILAYHRVLDIPSDGFPFDLELVSACTAAFRQQMAHLRKCWSPISLSAALDCVDAGRELPARAVVVSFDDGFSDNYTHAYPILREFDIPAVIFVSTYFVDTQRTLWFDQLAHAVLTTAQRALDLPWQDALPVPPDDAGRRDLLAGLLRRLKTMENEQRLALLQSVAVQLRCPPPARPHALSAPLSWEQIAEMASQGIEIGSHTLTHPILTTLDAPGIRRELADSRARIETQLRRPVTLLAYPVGGRGAFNENIAAMAHDIGYRAACCYISGTNPIARLERFALRRIAVERYVPIGHFKSSLALPALFA